MRVMLAVLAVIAMLLCGMPVPSASSAPAPPAGETAHARVHRIIGTAAAGAENVFIHPDGTVSLMRGPAGSLIQDTQVSMANDSKWGLCVAANSLDEFMMVWVESRDDIGDIYAQLLDSKGYRRGSEIGVATKANFQLYPRVTVDTNDDFLVLWTDERRQLDDVYAQRFDSGGARVGGEILVSNGSQTWMDYRMAAGPDGGFIVVYSTGGDQAGSADIYARRIDGNGNRYGDDIAVCLAKGDQGVPDIALLPSGDYLAIWSDSRDQQNQPVYAARINWNTGLTAPGAMISPANGTYLFPRIAADHEGNCVVAWQHQNPPSSTDNVGAAWINEYGARLGDPVVFPNATNFQQNPEVAADSQGRFIVTWDSQQAPYEGTISVFASLLDPSTHAAGPAIPFGTGDWNETGPALAVDSCDGFLIAWSDHRDASQLQIYARKYFYPAAMSGTLLTADISPESLYCWTALEPSYTLESPSTNTIQFDFSTDGGTRWFPLPADGSLAAAGNRPALRIRATFGTYDSSTSPLLYFMDLSYTVNHVPQLTVDSTPTTWRNHPVNISVRGQDPDNDTLAFEWEQLLGPPVSGLDKAGTTLMIAADDPGTYGFRIRASDGWNHSLPVTVDLTVTNHLPTLSCPISSVSASRGSRIQLQATGADSDGDPVQILWIQKSGPSVLFHNWSGQNLTFMATRAGEYTIQAVAYDGAGESSPVDVRLSVDDPAAAAATEQDLLTVGSLVAATFMVAAAAVYLFSCRRREADEFFIGRAKNK